MPRAPSTESLRYAERDQTIRTALLEARYVWGDRELFDELIKGFAQKFLTGDGRDFVEAKLAERDQRHQRMGDSRYVVEPNVKEGKGGLRDLHLLFWIAEYLYRVHEPSELVAKGVLTKEEARHFERAERFFTTVRCHIHYLTGRADDRLSFELQREIAARPGLPGPSGQPRRRALHQALLPARQNRRRPHAHLHRRACEDSRRRKPKLAALWQTLRPRELEGFRLDGERLAVASSDAFTKDPVAILRLFHVAQENDLDIHPATLRLITQNIRLVDRLRTDAEANRLFMADDDVQARSGDDARGVSTRPACSAASCPISVVSSPRRSTTCITPTRSTSTPSGRSASCRASRTAR